MRAAVQGLSGATCKKQNGPIAIILSEDKIIPMHGTDI